MSSNASRSLVKGVYQKEITKLCNGIDMISHRDFYQIFRQYRRGNNNSFFLLGER